MKHSRMVGHTSLCLLLLTIVNPLTFKAQSGTSSAISGTVTDATGAALPNAAVTATNVDTKAARAGQTNGDGRFLFSQVNPAPTR